MKSQESNKQVKKQKTWLFAVYGTLLSGFGNNRLFQNEHSKLLGTFKSKPEYTMYTGGFPVNERGGETAIIGEVWETTSEEVARRVFGLEGCEFMKQHSPSSWYDYDIISTKYGDAIMFVMNKGRSGRTRVVLTGDWRKDG